MNLDEATLTKLEALCNNVNAPWKLIPSSRTTTGTIILHDANGMSIADLQTDGPATDVDKLIAIAPTTIAELVAEVRRLRARLAPPKLIRQQFDCMRCEAKDVDGGTFGGYCGPCDEAVHNGAPDKLPADTSGTPTEGT